MARLLCSATWLTSVEFTVMVPVVVMGPVPRFRLAVDRYCRPLNVIMLFPAESIVRTCGWSRTGVEDDSGGDRAPDPSMRMSPEVQTELHGSQESLLAAIASRAAESQLDRSCSA